MPTLTPLAPSHGAGGVFCVEAIRPGPRRTAPHRGAARAASAHGAKRRHRPPTPRGQSGGRARLAHRRSPRCSQKSGARTTKTRSFCAITPRFLRRGGSAAEKSRKAARNHGHNHRKDENINFSSPNHQQKHVFTPCTSGEMQAEIRTFRRFRGKQGAEYSFYFKHSRTKNKKESTTHWRLRRKLCIFTFRPTHFVHSSNDCPHRCSKSTICPFASWGTMGKGRPLRVRNFPFFVQV